MKSEVVAPVKMAIESAGGSPAQSETAMATRAAGTCGGNHAWVCSEGGGIRHIRTGGTEGKDKPSR